MHPKRRNKERHRRLERLVIRNNHRNFKDARSNTDPEFYDNSRPRVSNVDDASYSDAINYFIGAGIQAARQGYQNTTDCIEFITTNVKEQLFWLRIYRYLFIIEKNNLYY